MATLTLPTTVIPGAGAKSFEGNANVVIAQGQAVYRDTATRQYKLAQSNAAATAVFAGIAMNSSGAAGGPVDIQNDGIIGGCSGLPAIGEILVLSDTVAGDLMPETDLTTGDYVSVVAVVISATQIQLCVLNTGITHA
jgi:hypothetical protein